MERNTLYRSLLPVALCISMAFGVFGVSGCGAKAGSAASSSAAESSAGSESDDGYSVGEDFDETKDKLARLQMLIDEYYMPTDEMVSGEDMQEGIYKGFVDSLDEPYTVYYTKEEYKTVMESVEGKYSGIGIIASQSPDTGAISVVRTFDGSPAQKEGLEKDDVLSKVEGKEVSGEDLTTVVSWIKGEPGTKVEIEVYRDSDRDYHTFNIERSEIVVPMVEYEMLDDDIAHISIMEFEETTAKQLDDALNDLYSQGMKALIIDLRHNPGGLVDSATDVLDRILPEGKLLVYTINKKEYKHEIYSKDDEKIDLPMAVLINGDSASASEIVSGCLQDYEVATIVGTTSFGKGVVQYILPLGDGSAIKLTSAYYYTPKGRNIHDTGIEPDVVVEPAEAEDNADEGAEEEEQDLQLIKAQEVLRESLTE